MSATDRTSRRGRHDHDHRSGRDHQSVSIRDHDRFRESLTASQRRFDEIDELVSDPLIERHASRRREHEAARVLRLLDELQPGGTNG